METWLCAISPPVGSVLLRTKRAATFRKVGSVRFGRSFHQTGKQIAYEWTKEHKLSLRVVNVDGTHPRVLYRSDFYVYSMVWSPDGKTIAAPFTNIHDHSYQIELVSAADGSRLRS